MTARVLTVGVFDLLHSGHLDLLDFCYDKASPPRSVYILIDSDRRVRELKGPSRPINTAEFRQRILLCMDGIVGVHIFDTIEEKEILIKQIKPNIFVKGGDYTPDKVLEKDLVESLGGKVLICPFTEGCSTTNIIEKMRKQ